MFLPEHCPPWRNVIMESLSWMSLEDSIIFNRQIMNGIVSLWFLPIAFFKWMMFDIHFVRKQWDGSSYSYEVQYIGRIWSPIYWIRIVVLFFAFKGSYYIVKKYIQDEISIVAAPRKTMFGYIPIRIPKPIRYLYFFTTLYIL